MNISKSWPRVYKGSLKSEKETNDCVVRAITETFNIPYDEAHSIAETQFKRQKRRGTEKVLETFTRLSEEDYCIGKYGIEIMKKDDLLYFGTGKMIGLFSEEAKSYHPITVKMFLKRNPYGRYLLIVNGHAFSVVDGTIIGNSNDGDKLTKKLYHVIIAKP